ncbi:hypothetical protein [Pseudomonas sp. BN606]|jgi:hypothetical protein|nr:hypothetical protein [Pseudomonas sp. BN606]
MKKPRQVRGFFIGGEWLVGANSFARQAEGLPYEAEWGSYATLGE